MSEVNCNVSVLWSEITMQSALVLQAPTQKLQQILLYYYGILR